MPNVGALAWDPEVESHALLAKPARCLRSLVYFTLQNYMVSTVWVALEHYSYLG